VVDDNFFSRAIVGAASTRNPFGANSTRATVSTRSRASTRWASPSHEPAALAPARLEARHGPQGRCHDGVHHERQPALLQGGQGERALRHSPRPAALPAQRWHRRRSVRGHVRQPITQRGHAHVLALRDQAGHAHGGAYQDVPHGRGRGRQHEIQVRRFLLTFRITSQSSSSTANFSRFASKSLISAHVHSLLHIRSLFLGKKTVFVSAKNRM
jgi:hypothetical protein